MDVRGTAAGTSEQGGMAWPLRAAQSVDGEPRGPLESAQLSRKDTRAAIQGCRPGVLEFCDFFIFCENEIK